jgi:hypothetical protein
MPLSSITLFRAARIAEQIESLQKQVLDLLEHEGGSTQEHRHKRRKVGKKPGIPSANTGGESDRGTLVPAVIKVLKQSKPPLRAAGIYERLVSSGYRFSFKDPKKVLQIRLYKMAGVQKAGKGLFKAKR